MASTAGSAGIPRCAFQDTNCAEASHLRRVEAGLWAAVDTVSAGRLHVQPATHEETW